MMWIWRGLIILCLVVLVLTGPLIARFDPNALVALCERLLAEIRALGWMGILLFAALQIIVAISGVIPASLLGVAAGTIYGLAVGFLVSAATTMIGADLAFLLSRSLFRPLIAKFLSRHLKLRNLDDLIKEDGWKLVCLLRVSPVMPFSATSYMLGLSKIEQRDYILGTLASLPALFGYVAMGALTDAGLSAWTQGESPLRWLLPAVGMLATIALIFHLRKILLKLAN